VAATRSSLDLERDPRAIVATRQLEAPRRLVWTAWTDPKHLAQWWGPNGFSTTTSAFDFRVGGVWRFVMHGRDGVDYLNKIIFVEIVRPERIVYDHVSGPRFRSTVTFTEEAGKTRLKMHAVFETAKERDMTIKVFHADEGGRQTLGRLAAFVEKGSGQ
jgi:uncharacterized protein YndB with AHSA1/START domain